jgi:hypothetical protein
MFASRSCRADDARPEVLTALRAILLGTHAILLGVGAAIAAAGEPMTATQLQVEVIGKRLCSPRKEGIFGGPICFTFRADGVFEVEADPGQDPRWTLDGDRLCVYRGADPQERQCFTFERVSKGRFRLNGTQLVCVNSCEE